MAKTRIQSLQRPHAKGKHQRIGQRAQVRENPPNGMGWGQKNWPGAGSGGVSTFGTWVWDVGTTTAGMAGTQIRANHATPASATHLFVSEVYAAGATGDPIATWVVNDPIRLYNSGDLNQWVEYKITAMTDAGAYRDYTVTFTAQSGWAPTASMPVLGLERTGSAADPPPPPPAGGEPLNPSNATVDEVKAYVDALTLTGEGLRFELQRLLDMERADKNRVTLTDWLDAKLGVI